MEAANKADWIHAEKTTLLAPTSGNTGIALEMMAAEYGLLS